jgi:hypothetical protein
MDFLFIRVSTDKKYASERLSESLKPHGISMRGDFDEFIFRKANDKLIFRIAGPGFNFEAARPLIHLDQLITSTEKIKALILSKLRSNKTIYARSCEIKKVEKETACVFFEKYHLMNATQSAFNYGLYFKGELVALASFSKGRKMNRLREDQRSFELIRFCSKSGITVTGGLSKLLKYFCEEKKAGDIMTYVDKQLSDGNSFIRAGFKRHGETEPHYFLVNRASFKRISASREIDYDVKKFYLSRNDGNVKLVFTP